MTLSEVNQKSSVCRGVGNSKPGPFDCVFVSGRFARYVGRWLCTKSRNTHPRVRSDPFSQKGIQFLRRAARRGKERESFVERICTLHQLPLVGFESDDHERHLVERI